MFKIARFNRKARTVLVLLILTFSMYAISYYSHTYLIMEDSDEKSDNITNKLEFLKSSSTIESTTITTESSNSYNFVVDMPSYRPDGDLYIAQIAMDEDVPFSSVPSGWTEIENGIAQQSGLDVRFAAYWRIGSTEPTSYTWSCSSSRLWVGAIYRISNFDSNDPIQNSGISTGDSDSPTAPSVSTTADNSLILRMFGADDDNTVSSYWPSGTTQLFQDDCGSDSVTSAAAYHTQSTAGSTGTAQFSLDGDEIWVAITIAITPGQEQVPPTFSNLIESSDPLELGQTETIRINVSDPSGINRTLIEYGGSNHSMTHINGDMWQYSWIPNTVGIHSYTIWIEDNYENLNSTSGSINVVDTIAPTYSDLIESADPLQLGQNETISIKIYDSPGSGVNQSLLEYGSTNYTMNYIVGNTWSWDNWKPASPGTFLYRVYMQDMQNNWNVTNTHNITVVAGTAPSIENLTESVSPLELGNNVTISVDATDSESIVSSVIIELEGLNFTMVNTVGNTYEFNWTRAWVGIVVYTIYANDTENNWNQLTDSFDIVDTISPMFNMPLESQDVLELGNIEIISINATDLTGINQVRIEFEGFNHSMVNIGGDTWQYDNWIPTKTGFHFYTLHIEDNNNNWNNTSGDISVQDTIAPVYSNLTVSGNPIELGEQLIIEIIVYDISDIKSVKIEYQGSNHSMANLGGSLWHLDSWLPTRADNYSYVIYMEDNNNNWNVTSSSIVFQDTTIPTYSNLIESADPLELGDPVIITIDLDDFAGINRSLIEYEGSNHTMSNIYGSVYQYNTWIPNFWTQYQYKIYFEDNSGNSDVVSGNITVQDTTAPSAPIVTNAPSGDVSGVLTFDWIDGSDPSGISYYVLMIDNESNPYNTPGYVFISNITNIGPGSSYYELNEDISPGSYYFFLIQIDGVGHHSSFTMGTFTMLSSSNGNNEFMIFLLIGIITASAIVSVTAITIVKRRIQKNTIPSRKKIALKTILMHIDDISTSFQISEKTEIQKPHKNIKNDKAVSHSETTKNEELMARINKIRTYGEKLFSEGAYLEAQKQFEFAENILLKLGKNEEALLFTDLTISIKELSEQRDERLVMLEKAKLGIDSLRIFELSYNIIELSEKLKDYDSADIHLSELTQFYQTEKILLKDLEYQRFKLYKQANVLTEEKDFEKSVGLYEKCEKISQFLVLIGRENEKNNVRKFREKIEEYLSKATQKRIGVN